MAATPSSTAFWTMRSMALPLGTAWASVIWQPMGADLPWRSLRRVTDLRVMAAISTVASSAASVEDDGFVAGVHAEDIDGVMGLGFVEGEGVEVPGLGGDVETMHRRT